MSDATLLEKEKQAVAPATLRGLTWDHPRAHEGLFAETARLHTVQRDVRIEWEKHGLRGFEATPIADLARRYDLIIMDHPFVGDAAAENCLLDLSVHAAALDLAAIEKDFIGPSLASYRFADGLWALPIDAACQASAMRPDLLARLGVAQPRTIEETLELGRRAPLALALATPHAFMNYLTICATLGADISGEEDALIAPAIGEEAVKILRALAAAAPREAQGWSSIDALDAMTGRDDLAFCPMVFCFNSYARRSDRRLAFGDVPGMRAGAKGGSVAGGTGLAVSASTAHPGAALAALRHFASTSAQRRMAIDGGQPASLGAWTDEEADRANGGFFSGCANAMRRAVLRPRYAGYMRLQDGAGDLLLDDLKHRTRSAAAIAAAIEAAHRSARAATVRQTSQGRRR